jgi:DNA polymerase III subunit delta'
VFDESLRGHSDIRSSLLSRLASNKLSRSLLFSGPDGIGKRRVAFELAQREICFSKSACGKCEGCKADPLKNEFPNLLRIAPEGKAGLIKVDAIREDALVEGGVIQWAFRAPPPMCHRWVVIEDAHRLGKSSANILLKPLEEPPEGTFFILLTHRPDSIMPTILSRLERISFAPLSPDEARLAALDNGWEERELDEWAAISSGTLKYLHRDAFEKAISQIDAWVSLLEGAPLNEASSSLLPDKSSELAQSQQAVLALEQLLAVLCELTRAKNGLQVRLQRWGSRLGSLAQKPINAKDGLRFALEAMRTLSRNVAFDAVLRKIVLALGV